MSNSQAAADRIEIGALSTDFTDAVMTRDYDRVASLFSRDGLWHIPEVDVEFIGRAEIRAGIERLQGHWEFFVQNAHPGTVVIDGDVAEGRTYIHEFGRLLDGRSHMNYSIYHDRFRRASDGWKFTERIYEMRYFDTSPLPGTPADAAHGSVFNSPTTSPPAK